MELYEKTNQLEKLSSIIAQTENLDLINSTTQFYKSNLFYKKGQFKEAINILNSIKFIKANENLLLISIAFKKYFSDFSKLFKFLYINPKLLYANI